MESETVNIYEYTDYKKFLQDKFEEKKRKDKNFSYRKFSHLAGLSSPSFLKLVIENKRNLSEAGGRKFAKGFRLSENQEEYFLNMVLMNQSTKHEEKDLFYRRMIQCKEFAKAHLLEKKEYEYYSEWYHPVVRELVSFNGGEVDAKWISEYIRPKITITQARRSLKLLEELSMIRREKDRWIQSDPFVKTAEEIASVLVTKYHMNMISLAKESIMRFPARLRDVSSVTIQVHPEDLPAIKEASIAFKKHLIGFECNKKKKEMVIQANIQIFPLCEEPKGNEP